MRRTVWENCDELYMYKVTKDLWSYLLQLIWILSSSHTFKILFYTLDEEDISLYSGMRILFRTLSALTDEKSIKSVQFLLPFRAKKCYLLFFTQILFGNESLKDVFYLQASVVRKADIRKVLQGRRLGEKYLHQLRHMQNTNNINSTEIQKTKFPEGEDYVEKCDYPLHPYRPC